MKEESIGKNKAEKGSSILEVLIALAVLTLGISAVIMLVFANQTLKLDSETSGEALYKAKDRLEDARANSLADFNSIISIAPIADGIYSKELFVSDLTACKKEVTSHIEWSTEPSRPQHIELKTNLVDIPEAFALGGDCPTEPPIGGWTNPATLLSRDLNYKAAYGDNTSVNSSAGNQATDVDVFNKTIYMTAGVSAPPIKDDFFILDGTNILAGVMPPIVGSLNTGPGLNAVDVARDDTTGNTYAYVANNEETAPYEQLIVIDVTDPVNPVIVASRSLPGVVGICPFSCPQGRSISYYQRRVYIGTHRTGGAEFHIYDVSDPTNPIPLGSIHITFDHNVNAIMVRGSYTYLATSDDDGELTILDVSNPATIPDPDITGTKFDAVGDEDGQSLYLLGNTIYLGRDRTPPARNDFYILDITNPLAITEIGSNNLSLNPGAKVVDIRVSGKFAFLAINDPTDGFQVLDISNPGSISRISTFNFSQKTTSLDYEDGFIYTSNESNDALRIIRPAECADKIDDDGDSKVDIADPECHTDNNAANPASYDPEDDDESS